MRYGQGGQRGKTKTGDYSGDEFTGIGRGVGVDGSVISEGGSIFK